MRLALFWVLLTTHTSGVYLPVSTPKERYLCVHTLARGRIAWQNCHCHWGPCPLKCRAGRGHRTLAPEPPGLRFHFELARQWPWCDKLAMQHQHSSLLPYFSQNRTIWENNFCIAIPGLFLTCLTWTGR
jgi:hypothetical protein